MNDYIFASVQQPAGVLTDALNDIYTRTPPVAHEFHGVWGSLAVAQGHYRGFQPYENERHLMVVIGGPVLYFRDNDFLVADDSNEATESIYHRWITEDRIQ